MCREYFSSQEIDSHHATEHRSTDQSRNGCRMCCFCHAQSFEAAPPVPTSRDFVHWRFSDAGRRSAWIASSCRRPKTCTQADICPSRALAKRDRGALIGAPLHAVPALPCLISCSFEHVSNDLLLILRHLRRAKLVRELVNLAGEAERKCVTVVHRRAGVTADVKRFVDGHNKRNRVWDRLCGHQLAIGRQYTGATLARAGAVVFEIEHYRVFAGLECIAKQVTTSHAAFPAVPF